MQSNFQNYNALRHSPLSTLPRARLRALTLCIGLLMLAGCNKNDNPPASSDSAASSVSQSPASSVAANVSGAPTTTYVAPTAEQLYQMVAPVALYPDKLLAQVLAASTYPDQVTAAQQWLGQNPTLKAGPLADAVSQQPWDPSIKSLTAFRPVLTQLASNLPWTNALGQAYYNDPSDVLNAVQVMRQRASKAGHLKTSSKLNVMTSRAPNLVMGSDLQYGNRIASPDQYIRIEPAQPDVVYVPDYNPQRIYGEQVDDYPGYRYRQPVYVQQGYNTESDYNSGYVPDQGSDRTGELVTAGLITFGTAVVVGTAIEHHNWGWHSWDMNWSDRPHRDRPAFSRPAVIYNNTVYESRSTTINNVRNNYYGDGDHRDRGGRPQGNWQQQQGSGWQPPPSNQPPRNNPTMPVSGQINANNGNSNLNNPPRGQQPWNHGYDRGNSPYPQAKGAQGQPNGVQQPRLNPWPNPAGNPTQINPPSGYDQHGHHPQGWTGQPAMPIQPVPVIQPAPQGQPTHPNGQHDHDLRGQHGGEQTGSKPNLPNGTIIPTAPTQPPRQAANPAGQQGHDHHGQDQTGQRQTAPSATPVIPPSVGGSVAHPAQDQARIAAQQAAQAQQHQQQEQVRQQQEREHQQAQQAAQAQLRQQQEQVRQQQERDHQQAQQAAQAQQRQQQEQVRQQQERDHQQAQQAAQAQQRQQQEQGRQQQERDHQQAQQAAQAQQHQQQEQVRQQQERDHQQAQQAAQAQQRQQQEQVRQQQERDHQQAQQAAQAQQRQQQEQTRQHAEQQARQQAEAKQKAEQEQRAREAAQHHNGS